MRTRHRKQMAAFCSGQSAPHTLCMQQRIKCTRSRSKAFRTEDTASSGSRDATPQVLTPAIRNLIREGKVHQIDGIIYTSAAENMIAMDTSIYNLFKEGVIDRHTAVAEAVNPEIMAKRLNLN